MSYYTLGNGNPHLTRERLWLVHLADGQNVARRALLFIPCRSQKLWVAPYKLLRVGLHLPTVLLRIRLCECHGRQGSRDRLGLRLWIVSAGRTRLSFWFS
jgi:hypothetical protein